jgi:hypothetical protein
MPFPPGFGSPMPGAPVPGMPMPAGAYPPQPGMAPGFPPMQAPLVRVAPPAQQQPRYVPSSSRAVQKSGQVHIYADSDVSYEEKRAKNPKYAQTIAQAQSQAAPVSAAPAAAVPAQAVNASPAQQAQTQAPPAPALTQADDGNPRVAGTKRARAADLI